MEVQFYVEKLFIYLTILLFPCIDFEHWLDDRFFGETPNNWRNEDCIQIKSGKFNDANCNDKYAFVCEKTA